MADLLKTVEKLRAGQHVTIVALGDSNTEQTFHTRGHMNYVSLLSEAIFEAHGAGVCTMINSGVCGDTADRALLRLDRDVLCFSPDLVMICLGFNDCGRGLAGLDDFRRDYRRIAEHIRESCGSELLLRTPNPFVPCPGPNTPKGVQPGEAYESPNRPLSAYCAAVVELATELGCAVVDHHSLWLACKPAFRHAVANPCGLWLRMGDESHPGAYGHLVFYRELAPLFDLPTRLPWEQ